MAKRIITSQYPARCADCGADLPPGSRIRYYGRGKTYGVDCHDTGNGGNNGSGYGDPHNAPFRDPGGRSALRAGKREYPCPTCGTENALTEADVRLGYQCDRCADAEEGAF